MLTIRKEQFDEIGRRLAHRWEDTMVLHLETFFPERVAELGEQGVRDAIEVGQKKAAKYNIFTERDVCKFLNFMFALGFDFDTDPELPWAKFILTNPAYGRSNLKMYLLEKAADGEFEPDAVPMILPTDEEMEAAARESEARDAAMLAELAEQTRDSAENQGDGDGNTGEK